MQRRDFLKMCSILGIGMPFLSSCASSYNNPILKPDEKVIIIGAGPAGLSAAYLLAQKGIDVTVLEAKPTYGGRIESTKDLADFTISLGAEWLHTTNPVLKDIVNDPSIPINIKTTAYDFDADYCLDAATGVKMNLKDMALSESDLRFTNTSWMDFYETYILPSIKDKIQYNKVVKNIDYTKDLIQITTDSETFTANRVIVTVPVTVLKAGDVTFIPTLPNDKKSAIQTLNLYSGLKCFIVFKEQFYPAMTNIKDEGKGPTSVYFDAAYKKNSKDNVLGLLAVGDLAKPYLKLEEEDRIKFILKELDELFDGQASPNYIKHVCKNWSKDPFAKGTYYPDFSMETYSGVEAMSHPVEDKLFFAGDLYTDGKNGWSMVHIAAESAKKTVEKLIGNLASGS